MAAPGKLAAELPDVDDEIALLRLPGKRADVGDREL